MLPLPRGAVWLLLFLFCAALYINGVQADGRVVCYYTNWSVYRPGTAKFNPQNINPYLCTHLIYAFGGFTKDNQMKPFDKYQDIEQGGYAKFTGLKTYNKQLKTMIAIGGWNEASSRFSPLVANPERRQKFIKNILKFLRQNHFDGIDLDWEYPAHREGGKPRDRDNYAQFVQELRAEFERESEKTGRPRLLLTMAVPAGIEYIEKGYDIPKLNKYLDWFNVLTYDFHSSHEPSVNHHAPLYSLEEESEYNYDAELNIDYSIKFYLNAGADRDKLVLGIPTYGRSYTLINEESTEIGAPAEAPGEQGDATREKGYLAYYEICQNIKEDPEWTVVQPNPNAMGPYAYRRNQWVGYDDEAIVRKKAQYVVENGLGGIMFWAIDNDDFRGTCTGKPYPLIEAAKEAMLDSLGLGINEVSKPSAPQKPSRSRSRENSSSTRNRITTTEHKLTYAERKGGAKRTQQTQQTTRKQQSTTTAAPTTFKLTEAEGSSLYIGGRTTTPPPPTTPDPGTDFKCEEEGFFQHPRDCKKYYWCLDSGPSGLGIVAHQFTCPSGLYFNPAADSCDFARNVPCKTKKSTTAAPVTSTTTTTARPTSSYNRITAATSRPTTFFRTTPRTTTTTTTLAPEEEEYEDEEDNLPSPFAKNKSHHDKDSEEDPKVIKELIELIRKVGGVEELEKHLLRKDDGTISIKESSSSSSTSQTATTPSSISKSLYEKVLSKPNALNSFRNRFTSTSSFRTTKTQIKTQEQSETDSEESQEGDSKSSGATSGFSKYSSVLRSNSRQGPQSEGIDKLSEFDGFQKEKKQYITINRNRGTKKTDELEEEEVAGKLSSESHVEETEEEVEKSSVKSTRRPLSASTPAYSTIRRTRPSTTTETTQDEEEEQQEEKEVTERKTYSSLNRSRIRGTTTTELPEVTEVTAGSSRYKYLERTRPTRPTTESSNKVSDEDDDDIESENQENTVHFKAVKNIESTRETQQQQEITKNTQRTYASIGRRTTTSSTTATPETETTSAAKTTTTATPTTSTTETSLTTTTPLTILETTTPESILLTTIIPITTTTNPITTTSSTTTTKTTTTTSLTNDEDVLENLATTTTNPNDISSDISETLLISQNINSLLTESSSSIYSTPSPTTESGLDTNDSQLTTTTETTSTSTAINDSDNLTKTEDTEHEEEVNLVSKQTNKTLYNTRTRITTTTTPPTTTTTTTNSDIETTNAKKTLGVRRQQILLNRSSQKTVSTSTDTAPTTTATESVNNDFLGTVSSPRPFGFPKRRIRPTSETNTEEVENSNDETIITRQKTTTTTATTKLSAAANNKFKKYQFQRRTTTTTTTSTTTTTEKPVEEVKEDIDVANAKQGAAKTKIQVNVNEDSESETSTSITETTTAPITTESPSSPATHLPRRIKVLKLKRPVGSSSNNTITNVTATILDATHTETQNIVKLSSVSEVDSQKAKNQTLTETNESTETQNATTEAPAQQTSPTPKRIRKVIRKLIRPVNRTVEISNEKETEKSSIATTSTFLQQRRQNSTRFGFNRSSKFNTQTTENKNTEGDEDSSDKEETDDDEEETEEKKSEVLTSRGRNRFTLPTGTTSTTRTSLFGTANRNRFNNRIKTTSLTTKTTNKNDDEDEEEDEEDEDDEDEDEDSDEDETVLTTTTSKPISSTIYTSPNRYKFSRPTTVSPESSLDTKEETETSNPAELETTTINVEENESSKESSASRLLDLQKLRNKIKSDQTVQQEEGVLNDRLKISKTSHNEESTDDPFLKLRNKVKQDLAKGNQEDGVLSVRLKTKTSGAEEELEKDDPLLKLRNKVKQDLTKGNQEEGILSIRLKTSKTSGEDQELEKDDPLLKLRNKVKQDLAKGNQEEGVLSDRLKLKSETDVDDKDDALLKLRIKVKQDLAKGNQDEGVVNVKLKKLLETKNTTATTLNYKVDDTENDSSTTQDSLNLQNIRDKVQNTLAKGEQEEGVVSTRLKKLLSERTSSTLIRTNSVEEEEEDSETTTTTETKESSGDGDLIEFNKQFSTRKPFVPRTRLTPVDNESETPKETQSGEVEESTTSVPRVKPTFRRKLVAKRPYVPTKPPLSALRTTTIKIPTTKGKKKYVRRKFGRFHPFNASNRNTGEGFVRKDPRGNILPGTDRFRIEGSAGGHSGEGEDYEEYDEEEEEGEDEEVDKIKQAILAKPVQPIKPVVARPPGLFNRPQTTILKKPVSLSKEQGSGYNEDVEEEEEDEDEDEDEEEDEEEEEEGSSQEPDKIITNRPTYKPKDNRVPPGSRPALTTIPTIKKPFTPSRIVNNPYRPGAVTTPSPNNRANRLGVSSRSTVKPRVVNRPLGVSVPHLTIKPVANDFERTTVLIPTKPAPFINPNTRAYERKYTGPTTESPLDSSNDVNPLIEDLNIEALNARNKKIFDINSKKHTTLKPKVIIPAAKLNENTQQQTNTEFENGDYDYETSVNGYATTITSNTNTQYQEHQQQQQQSATLDNTLSGTQNTDDANLSNLNNLNEISSQDGFTTTPSPSTTLLHIFTLSDNDQTTPNPLTFPRVIAERVKPKHKVVEINRIVEVNSKEEKLRRKSKANIIIPVEGSQTFKVESLPHVEPLGEISVVKYVHQVDGSDITIEGRSTVTDYTPTEPTVPWTSEPVRHSLTEGRVEERYGKALVPEVIREAIETSTISLEGLFESARKGKVLNTVDDATFVNTESTTANEHPELNKAGSAGEGFSILKSIAFDTAKINLEPNSQEIEKVSESNASSSATTKTSVSSSSITSDTHEVNAGYSNIPVLTTTPAPEILNVESSTVASEETKATTVAAALFPQYVRPIVPLLRPESNESSPLVISIANLDKVILSKVRKMVDGVEVEVDEQHQDQPQTQIRTQQIENNIVSNSPSVTTETPVTLTTPINLISILSNNNAEQSLKVNNQQESQQLVNNIISNTQTETNEIPKTTLTNPTNTISVLNSKNDDQSSLETQIQQHSTEILDSNGAFSSRLASVIKAPLSNSLSHIEKKVKTVKNSSENSLDNAEQVTQTELYTINEGSVGSTTSSTLGSKISETISYSSETTVVRLKQPRKSKSRKFKNKKNSITTFTTIAPATELFSQ